MDDVLTIQPTRETPPCSIVIFGASGDLAKRKLLPALYNLVHCAGDGKPLDRAVIGFARSELTREQFRNSSRESIDRFSRLKIDPNCWSKFEQTLDYLPGLDSPDGFKSLRAKLEKTERERGIPSNRIFYLSTPPEAYGDIVARLAAENMIPRESLDHTFTRVVVEKPIGHDLPSAREINNTLRKHLAESQIFRIDHYLGKESVQNLLVLRFANSIFERLWGSRNVDHVQITVAEAEGVGSRAGYYDHSGALRDMVQNHLLQLLCLLAMEAPVTLDADSIRESKLNVLRALRPIRAADARLNTVRARYSAGMIDNTEVAGYLQERGVPSGSHTETYVALRLFVDNWRWSGVPFYLRTGKRLPRRASAIVVHFKDVPHILFNREGALPPNLLTLRIQPDEGFEFDIVAKPPGLSLTLRPVRMNLSYKSEFEAPSPDAYERLLLDVIHGDRTLFASNEFVNMSWQFIQGILDAWNDGPHAPPMHQYAAGSWGPHAADELLRQDARGWREP